MTYPQSGSGYGQGDAGQSAYGQQQYGQQQAGYGQQQYGQQAGYGQQQYSQQGYGQQQYGYQAPKPPSQGLPANTSTILAAVVGALGVITLFCGFISVYKSNGESSFEVFNSVFATPYSLVALAGVLALLTFLVGTSKHYVALVAGLSITGALITIFQFAKKNPLFDSGLGSDVSHAAGAIVLLIFSILMLIASVVWLLVETGHIKTAPAVAGAQAAAAPAADASAYGAYGQQAQAQQPATYGQQAQPTYQPQPGEAYGQQAASGYQQPTSSPSNPLPSTPADPGATTAFQKPEGQ